jgi:hypothetical protein
MLKMSVKTKLDQLEALDRVTKYFEEKGLTLLEGGAHLHGRGGFIETRVSGGKLLGNAEYDAKIVLNDLTKYIENKFGFQAVESSLHFHTPIGFVDVSVSSEKPIEVTFETMEYEYQVRECADKLPKA